MIKDTILLSSIINWLMINSLLIGDDKISTSYVPRILPKSAKRLIEALEPEEL